jgi:hypothetical protein
VSALRAPAAPAEAGASTRTHVSALVWSAAVLSTLGAALLHVVAAIQHADHSELVSGFFVIVALAQLGGAALLVVTARGLVRERTAVLLAGILVTTGLMVLYFVAHGTDLLGGLTGHQAGAGGHHGATGHSVAVDGPVALSGTSATTEENGLLGAATLAVQLVTVVSLTALLPTRLRGWVVNALCLMGALTWALWFTGVLR